MNTAVLMGILQPFKGNVQKIVQEQTTGDIIDAIMDAHNKYQSEYAKIAPYFKGRNDRATAQNIWNFLKLNIKYQIEPGNRQTVKSPSALLAQGYGDCKHYAKFAAGILQNLNIPYAYRFSSYRYLDSTPQHVFVVVNPGTKNEIWIDPVLPTFDNRKKYFHSIDKKMSLYSISGIGQTRRQQRRAAKMQQSTAAQVPASRREQRQVRQAARKAAGKTLGQRIKKGTRIVARVAAAPARNAFLLLVRINFANLATRLNEAWIKAPSRLQNFWEGIGGQMQALKKAFETGKRKRRIFGIGAAPAAPAAAAAAAAPILAAVAKFLKDIGIEPGELVEIGKDAVNTKVQQLMREKFVAETEQQAVQNIVADEVQQDMEATTESRAGSNMLPLIVGGAVVAFLLIRKK